MLRCDHQVVRHLKFSVAAALSVLLGGCVGPWTRHAALPTPAAGAIPTGVDIQVAPPVQQPAAVTPNPLDTNDRAAADPLIYRGQSPGEPSRLTAGSDDHYRQAMPVTGVDHARSTLADPQVQPAPFAAPPGTGYESIPPPHGDYSPEEYAPEAYSPRPPAPRGQAPHFVPSTATPSYASPSYLPYDGSGNAIPFSTVGPNPYAPGGVIEPLPGDYADLVVNLRETQTGRFMFGVGVNSDLGLSAQVIIDERNFDWRRYPTSFDDLINGTAWRGGGQALRIEAVPGTEVQRYLVNFTEPYLWDTPITLNVSGYLYDRRYFDWDEQRLGGRIGLGYRITPDLSLSFGMRVENVFFHDPRVRGVPEIAAVLGDNELYAGRVTLAHDTRDIPFSPTQGHYMELSVEQAFGTFSYPRANLDYRRYFLLRERADRSGRHTMGLSFKGGITGSETPVYENYFAGGYSTIRGFRFRNASPKALGVIVGGELSLLGSAEYIFPITADDMLKGAIFLDYGTVEEKIEIHADDFRVAVGAGLRISVPAMGPAPIAIDCAVPIARESTDRIQNFSFFVGFGR